MGFRNSDTQDIKLFPKNTESHVPKTRVVSGDMHGNVINLLHYLLFERIIDIPQDAYEAAIEIYYDHPTIDKSEVSQFINLLKLITIKTKDVIHISIGDEFYDRGKNDGLSLLLFDKLDELNVEHYSLFSNHTLEFLKCFCRGLSTPFQARYHNDQVSSMSGLQHSLQKQAFDEAYLNKCILNFLKTLRLLMYDERNDQEIVIYSHVPISHAKIKNICELLVVSYAANTVNELKQTIDAINIAFSFHMKDKESLQKFLRQLDDNQDNRLDKFVHDRYPESIAENSNTAPYSYIIINPHGHVGSKELTLNEELQTPYVVHVSIDTNKGKTIEEHAGPYWTWIMPPHYQKKLNLCKSFDKFLVNAVKKNSFSLVKKALLEAEIDINYHLKNNLSPLFLAINKNNPDIIKELLNEGASLLLKHNGMKMDCLRFAILNNKIIAFQTLLAHPKLNKNFNNNWLSYIIYAIENSAYEIAKILINKFEKRDLPLIDWALEYGADEEIRNKVIPALFWQDLTLTKATTEGIFDLYMSHLINDKLITLGQELKQFLERASVQQNTKLYNGILLQFCLACVAHKGYDEENKMIPISILVTALTNLLETILKENKTTNQVSSLGIYSTQPKESKQAISDLKDLNEIIDKYRMTLSLRGPSSD